MDTCNNCQNLLAWETPYCPYCGIHLLQPLESKAPESISVPTEGILPKPPAYFPEVTLDDPIQDIPPITPPPRRHRPFALLSLSTFYSVLGFTLGIQSKSLLHCDITIDLDKIPDNPIYCAMPPAPPEPKTIIVTQECQVPPAHIIKEIEKTCEPKQETLPEQPPIQPPPNPEQLPSEPPPSQDGQKPETSGTMRTDNPQQSEQTHNIDSDHGETPPQPTEPQPPASPSPDAQSPAPEALTPTP